MTPSACSARQLILRSCPASVLLSAAIFLGGCAASERNDVSGEITYDGKPVPAGRIYFTPDLDKGNDGPQGYAPIKDGKYDTRKDGQGATGGPMIVVIKGYNGVSK